MGKLHCNCPVRSISNRQGTWWSAGSGDPYRVCVSLRAPECVADGANSFSLRRDADDRVPSVLLGDLCDVVLQARHTDHSDEPRLMASVGDVAEQLERSRGVVRKPRSTRGAFAPLTRIFHTETRNEVGGIITSHVESGIETDRCGDSADAKLYRDPSAICEARTARN